MNFEEMISALTPHREEVTIKGFKFYARPMTVQEFGEFFYAGKSEKDRNALMILNCIQNEAGEKVFTDIEQISKLYTTVRSQLAHAETKVSILSDESADETEKE